MFDKLAEIEKRYIELEELLNDPDVYRDPQHAAKLPRSKRS